MPVREQLIEESRGIIEPFLSDWRTPGRTDWEAFRDWAVSQVLWDFDPSNDEVTRATQVDSTGDVGIDAWYSSAEDGRATVVLVQAKDTRASPDDIDKMCTRFANLFDPESTERGRANLEIRARCAELDNLLSDDSVAITFQFWLVTSHIASRNLRARADELASRPIRLRDIDYQASLHVRDISDLAENLRTLQQPEITVVLQVPSDQFIMTTPPGSFRTLPTVVPANQIAQWFAIHRINLFRLNPRYFQGTRGRVNQKMMETLGSVDKQHFFLYNNGITALADAIITPSERLPVSRSTGTTRIELRNFQIVNGCQTTAALHEAKYRRGINTDDVLVHIRVSEAPPTIAKRIASYTNAQNAPKAEDSRSNDAPHDRLQQEFDRLLPRWFYEYKRGVWTTEIRSDRDKDRVQVYLDGDFAPRRITLKDLVQASLSFLGDPRNAAESPRSIFENDRIYEKVFQENVAARQLLLPVLIYRCADEFTAQKRQQPNLEWAPYLRYSIVYCVSHVLHALLTQGKELKYFDADVSVSLCSSVRNWSGPLIETCFDALADRARTTVGAGVGGRGLVRREGWVEPAVPDILRQVQAVLRVEAQAAERTGVGAETIGLRALLPISIGAEKVLKSG